MGEERDEEERVEVELGTMSRVSFPQARVEQWFKMSPFFICINLFSLVFIRTSGLGFQTGHEMSP